MKIPPDVLGDLDRYLLAEGTHLRAYERLGAHPTELDGMSGTAFALWAPNARAVSVVGDFNGWDGRCDPMRQVGQGFWETFVPGASRGHFYKFEIQSASGEYLPLKSDPFAFATETPPGSASRIHGLLEFPWADGDWMRDRGRRKPHASPLTIYEVHLGSWMRGEDGRFLSYLELAERLIPYVQQMGFTHLEFMPVMEHPFYGSWGYQPLGLFAPTSRYGAPEDFAALINAAHRAGLGVILDWVPAHFPEDAFGLVRFDGTCLFEHEDPRQGRHEDWGTLIYNYGRWEVANVLMASALFWLDRFHVDALRVDAVASMLYADYSRQEGAWIPNRFGGRENLEAVGFLRRLNETLYAAFPDAFTLAEESTAWPGVSRPTSAGGLGFGFKWNMGWMHDTLSYMSRHAFYRRYHHDQLTFSMLYAHAENFVLPLSHDEVVYGKRSLLGRMPGMPWERFANLRLLLAYQHAHGGKKHLFMGSEFGQENEWDHTSSLEWGLLQSPLHAGVQTLVRDLNSLHRRLPELHEGDCEPWGFRWVDCGDKDHSVLSILRQGNNPQDVTVIVLNFTAQTRTGYRVGVPKPGRYTEVLNTDSSHYGGSNTGNSGGLPASSTPAHGFPHSLVLTLPPLGALFLKPA